MSAAAEMWWWIIWTFVFAALAGAAIMDEFGVRRGAHRPAKPTGPPPGQPPDPTIRRDIMLAQEPGHAWMMFQNSFEPFIVERGRCDYCGRAVTGSGSCPGCGAGL